MIIKYDKKTVLRLPEDTDKYYETEAERLGTKANTLKTMVLVQQARNNEKLNTNIQQTSLNSSIKI
ncbi:TPA: hypothetical protein QCX12_003985 [Bacillus paranthracis]|nr:hypothetical protein [Bacillus paranthracis]HDR7523503.1 hypothetical protein [Bacillus paranthracis]